MTEILDTEASRPEEAVAAIRDHGCFVLRNAVDPSLLEGLHEQSLRFFELAKTGGAEAIATALKVPMGHVAGHAEGAQKRGVIHHSLLSMYLFKDASALERRFGVVLADRRIYPFLQSVLGRCILHTNNLAVRYRDVGREDLALPFHQDSFYFNEPELYSGPPVMLVVWLPFVACNADTPGLELVPQPLAEIAAAPIRSVPKTQFHHLEADVPDELEVWYPEVHRGDAIIFAERTLHRSYGGQVKNARTSIDLRLFAEGKFPKVLAGHRGIKLPGQEIVTVS